MSRVGMSNIKIPEGVTVTQDADKISAKGKVGELSVKTNEIINIKIDNNIIVLSTNKKTKHGTCKNKETRTHKIKNKIYKLNKHNQKTIDNTL